MNMCSTTSIILFYFFDATQQLYKRVYLALELISIVSSVQSLSRVWLFVTPRITACQASLYNSQSSLKLMSIESVMPSSHLILCCPLLFPPSIFPIIRVFSNESVLCIRWPKYWNFSFNNYCNNIQNNYFKDIEMIFTLDILLQMVKRPLLVIYELYSSNYWKSGIRENLYTSYFWEESVV